MRLTKCQRSLEIKIQIHYKIFETWCRKRYILGYFSRYGTLHYITLWKSIDNDDLFMYRHIMIDIIESFSNYNLPVTRICMHVNNLRHSSKVVPN